MNSDTLINKIKRLFSSARVLDRRYQRRYQENVLDEYQNAWDVSLPINNKNLRSCEQKLIKLDKKELEYLLKQHFSNHTDNCKFDYIAFHLLSLNCTCDCFGIKEIHEHRICVLLHLIHVFCIPGQDDKIKLVQVILNELLQMLAEGEIYRVFKRYLSQQLKVKSSLTEIDLLAGKIHPYNEFLLKLCYWNVLCAKDNNQGCKEFLKKNADILVSKIEGVVNKNSPQKLCCGGIFNEKMFKIYCNILLCVLNWNLCKTQHRVILQKNMESPASSSDAFEADTSTNYSFTAHKVRNMLYTLLSTLSEDDIFTAFNNYLDLMCTTKSEITEEHFCSGKIEPYHELLFKLCYCTKKWGETKHAEDDFITKNTQFFLSMLEEVNKRNHLRMKFKMCQVLSIITNGKIHITESMICSITRYKTRMVPCFLHHKTKLDTCYKTDIHFALVPCLLHLKTKLDNFRKLTEKISLQYQDHIKELLLSLLTHVLTLIPTQVILEAVYHSFENSCVANQKYQNIQLELAKTFLDISINPKTSHENKLIIGSKIQQTFIIRDTSKTALPPSAEFADSTEEKLDYKRMINICINVVKTQSKDINVPMYEGLFCSEKKAIENEVEMVKRSQETETLVLLMLLLITITSTGHHKSAKLKKYLTLKYEYYMASLYLLWCSGDIEVHPGPSLNKKKLAHDSTIERRWIQNISPKILDLLPEHEQLKYKPTKKVQKDNENRDHLKTLLKTCLEESIPVRKMYLAELNAWETKKYKLLHKLFVYRCEIETIIASLKDFLTSGGRTNDLTACNISYATELKTHEIAEVLGKDQRPKDKSQLMAYIPGKIANILIKCAHGEDPDAKHDGLWDLFLKDWPTDIILFDPNNREKYSKKHPGQKLIPDQELVDILLTLPQVTIPQKYKDIVDAFRTMRKSQKNKSTNKQHKAELCSTFKRITSLEKLEYAIKNLWESGVFTEEVHNNLIKWWTTGAVETTDDKHFSQVDIIEVQKRRRPHILINISTKSITLTVEQTDANSSHVSYDFPFSDELVPLKTMATTVHQTTIQKPSSDSCQMVTAKKYTVSSKQDACSVDNQTYSIIIPPLDLNPNSQAILESDIKHPHKISTEETALCSTIDFDQSTSSTKQISQLNQNIATSNQSTTNSDDISSAIKDSKSLHFHTQVSPTSDMGSSDSISSVTSKSGNEDGDQINIPNGSQVLLTDSDYSSDGSNNCVSKTNMQKRKFKEEDRNEMKKRKIPSQEDKKPIETNHRQMDCLMDNTASFNKNREILPDWLLDSDLDSYDIDNQTFKVDMNALNDEDTELVKFLKDIIDGEGEMKSCNLDE